MKRLGILTLSLLLVVAIGLYSRSQNGKQRPNDKNKTKNSSHQPYSFAPDVQFQIKKYQKGRVFFHASGTISGTIRGNPMNASLYKSGQRVYGSQKTIYPDSNGKITYKVGPYRFSQSSTLRGKKIPPGIYLLTYRFDTSPETLPEPFKTIQKKQNLNSIHPLHILKNRTWSFALAETLGTRDEIERYHQNLIDRILKARNEIKSVFESWEKEVLKSFERYQTNTRAKPDGESLRQKCKAIREVAGKHRKKLKQTESSISSLPFQQQRNQLRHVLEVIGTRCVEYSWQLYRNLGLRLPNWITKKIVRGGIVRDLEEVLNSLRREVTKIDDGLPETTREYSVEQHLNEVLRWYTWITLQPYRLINQYRAEPSENTLISDILRDNELLKRFSDYGKKWITIHERSLKNSKLLEAEKKKKAYNWISSHLKLLFEVQLAEVVRKHKKSALPQSLEKKWKHHNSRRLRKNLNKHRKTIHLMNLNKRPDCRICAK